MQYLYINIIKNLDKYIHLSFVVFQLIKTEVFKLKHFENHRLCLIRVLFEPLHEKTNKMLRRKQIRRSAVQ